MTPTDQNCLAVQTVGVSEDNKSPVQYEAGLAESSRDKSEKNWDKCSRLNPKEWKFVKLVVLSVPGGQNTEHNTGHIWAVAIK